MMAFSITLYRHLIASLLLILALRPSNAISLPESSLLRHPAPGFSTWTEPRPQRELSRWLEDRPELRANLLRYDGDVVVRFNVYSAQHEAALRKAVDQMVLDVWDFTANYTDIRVHRRQLEPLLSILPASLQDNHSILITDVARVVAASYPSNAPAEPDYDSLADRRDFTPTHEAAQPGRQTTGVDDVFFHDYQPRAVINDWMRLLDSMFRGRGIVQLFSIGKSYEGRDILGLKVGMWVGDASASLNDPQPRRDTILVTGGLHAREWISTSTTNYLTWSFIQGIDKDPTIAKILDHFDIIFIPVLNPDGYEYTWEVDRLWRKSRQPTGEPYCNGYDLNHAFGYRWAGTDHQDEPCSQSYGGQAPFEAVEARRLADWSRNETDHGANFVGYIDLHSYSQQVLYPYAYSCGIRPPNLENLQEVAMNLAKRMRLTNGEVYTVASACEGAAEQLTNEPLRRIEAAGGSAMDYIFHDLGARYSYQIKLRDTGSYGFLLPSDDIIPTGEEVFQAMKYFGDFLLGNNGRESIDTSTEDLTGEDGAKVVTELRRRGRRR
ncbi:hypothetical protein GGR56DRAFT_657293 [Xylariaceae sp. FL0804]|nr:hypothetical protein GGR56DRAFT_657293 [Xylariaceae sp. FL0804]